MDMLKMAFVGLGQYGGRQVDSFLSLSRDLYSGMAVNTSSRDLAGLSYVLPNHRYLLGNTNGAGRTPQVAYNALLENAEEFFDLVQDVTKDADYIWLVAGLGGGTGTGALLLLLEHIGQLFDNPPGLILTVPRPTDGVVQIRNAVPVLSKVQQAIEERTLGSVILLDNEYFFQKFAEEKRAGDWRDLSNQTVASLLHDLNMTTAESGTANFDREDFRKVLSVPGCLAIAQSTFTNPSPQAVSKQIERNLSNGYISFGYRLHEAKVFVSTFSIDKKSRAHFKTENQKHIESYLHNLFPDVLDQYMAFYETERNNLITLAGGLGFPKRVIDLPNQMTSAAPAETVRFQAPSEMDLGGLSSLMGPAPVRSSTGDNPFRKSAPAEEKPNPFTSSKRKTSIKPE